MGADRRREARAVGLFRRGAGPGPDIENAWRAFAASLKPPYEGASFLLALLDGLAELMPAQGYYAYMAEADSDRLSLRATRTAAGLPQVGPNYAGLVAGQPLEPAVLEVVVPEEAPPVRWEEGVRPSLLLTFGRAVVLRASVRESRAQDVRLRRALDAWVGRLGPVVAVLVAHARAQEALEATARRAVTSQRAVEIALDPDRLMTFVARLGAEAVGASAGYLVVQEGDRGVEELWSSGDATALGASFGPALVLPYLRETRVAMWSDPRLPPRLLATGFRFCAAVRGGYDREQALLALASPRLPTSVPATQALLARLADALVGIVRDRQETVAATRSYVDSLTAVADLVDAANPYAPQHSRQVASLAQELAMEMEGDPAWAKTLELAGRLHDVGMAAIGLDLPARSGSLAESDRQVIRQHPDVGADLLSGLTSRVLPDSVARAVRHHHERWDGEGYPAGLRGEAIPPEARILAAAELFMGYTSARSYRPGLSPGRALYELTQAAGTAIDPAVLRALTAVCAKRGVRALPPGA